jgi:membrane-bound lytic murein transglycosylase D
MRKHKRTWTIVAPAATALLVASGALAGSSPEYPYELLIGGKSVPKSSDAEPGAESPELKKLRELDMELFPPGEQACTEDPSPLGGEFLLHGGPVKDLFDVLSSAFPIVSKGTQKAKGPVPLMSDDLGWLEDLEMPDVPVRWDDRVVVYLDRFRSDGKWRKIIRSWLSRSERYGPEIRRVLRDRGMPEDLQYVAMIESGYNPKAVSSAGAVGLWQFMPATGAEYGLVRTKWVDQRRNPELSTVAAAQYLSDLEERLGSWYLALAAYNMGYGALLSSMKKYNTNDYWKLARYEAGLPWGTVNYVPKILAAAIVGRNREAFGMSDLDYEPTIEYDVAIVTKGCKLSRVAKAAGVGTKEIMGLNPELRKSVVPPDMLPYPVRIPDGKGPAFEKGWPAQAAKIQALKPYEVKFGDTLTRIAKVSGSSVKELVKINDIRKADRLVAGEVILVPANPPAKQGSDVQDEPVAVSVPSVKFVYPGHRRIFYEIIDGDTLGAVAAFFGVTVNDLAIWNELDPSAYIHTGMWLQLFVPEGKDLSKAVILEEGQVKVLEVGGEEFLAFQAGQAGKERVKYVVEEGDTLKSISKKFDVKISSIVRINQFGYKTDLVPGQEIVLYVKKKTGENPSGKEGGSSP